MRNRILATASTIGILLNGVVLARAGVFAGPVASAGKVATVAGNVAAMVAMPRTASAATAALHHAEVAQEQEASASPDGETVLAAYEPRVMPIPNQTPAPGAGTRVQEATGGSCPAGMVFVEGDYCPEVRHECKHWLEETGKFAYFRCDEYTKATCLSKEREHKRFCIDRDEYTPPGEKLPASHQSWTHATRTCESIGKRVCRESEWQFACEGEEMRPYPYGWRRDPDACNADLTDIYRPDGKLRDLRVGADDKPRCVSPFGVHNLSGNLEEWTTIDASANTAAPRPAMKGAYWQPSRNHCRAAQTAHDRFYKGTETGFRCCSDVE